MFHLYTNYLLFIFTCSLAISDYRQSLQFQNLNKEKRNIQLEVCAQMFVFIIFVSSLLVLG